MNALAPTLLVSLLIACIAGSVSAQESRTNKTAVSVAAQPEASVFAKRTLTGKERLGPKWTDEQRIDDCNVPVEKRGRPRPTACSQSALGF